MISNKKKCQHCRHPSFLPIAVLKEQAYRESMRNMTKLVPSGVLHPVSIRKAVLAGNWHRSSQLRLDRREESGRLR